MSFWCPFLDLYLATHRSNIGVRLKISNQIRPAYLVGINLNATQDWCNAFYCLESVVESIRREVTSTSGPDEFGRKLKSGESLQLVASSTQVVGYL